MTRFAIFAVTAVLVLAAPALATIPSFGTQTAEGIRSAFNDSDFKLTFADGIQVDGGTFSFSLIDVGTFPVLAGQDVQSSLARVTLDPGTSDPTHSHPRAGETIIIDQGMVEAFFVFEGLVEPRVVTNTLSPGDATVVPQGLIHGITCLSETPCMFTTVAHSADGGIVSVVGF